MRIQEVIELLEAWAPRKYAEDFDNTGLLVGDANSTLSGVLVSLDCLEEVVDEAVEKGCNLVVSFHPIIFKGLKKLTGSTYVERAVLKAIKNDIAIYAIHTALDNNWEGVNHQILKTLGANKQEVLIPKPGTLKKLITYAPNAEVPELLDALFAAGAGAVGDYSECSFTSEGQGSYKPGEGTNPASGSVGQRNYEAEHRIEVLVPLHNERKVVATLKETHSYEEVAYELVTINNTDSQLGMGMIGSFDKPLAEADFLALLKDKMDARGLRHSKLLGKQVKKIAVLGGSGAFAIGAAKAAGVDAYVSADFKYHDFFTAENALLLVDIGHYESEQYTKNLIVQYLSKKITNFAVLLSEIKTNPIFYL